MYIFNTLQEFQEAEQSACEQLGLPDEETTNYAPVRKFKINGVDKWIMPEHTGITIDAESLEYQTSWEI